MSEKSLRAAEQLRADFNDPLGKIIEAGYHCAMTNAELYQLMTEQGIEHPSEETLHNLRGEYTELVEAAYGIDGEKARQAAECKVDGEVGLNGETHLFLSRNRTV